MRRKLLISIILFAFIFITSNILLAQQHRQRYRREQDISTSIIKGKVVDSDKHPISQAVVLIPEIGISVETDASGYFELKQIPKGKYHLEIIKEGYMPYRSDVFELTETKTAQKTPAKGLESDSIEERDEVVITKKSNF